MNRKKYVRLLSEMPIAKYMAAEDLEYFFEIGSLCRHKKKEIIFYEGTFGKQTHFLMEGIVRLYRSASNGHERTLVFVKPGEMFGNIPLADHLEHTVTAEVFEPALCLTLENRFIRAYIKEKPQMLWYLAKDLTYKLRTTNQALEEAFLAAEQRFIRAILLIVDRFGRPADNGIELTLRFTQDDLARFSGTTRSTVAHVISSFIEKGILSTKPKPWIVHDLESLRRMI